VTFGCDLLIGFSFRPQRFVVVHSISCLGTTKGAYAMLNRLATPTAIYLLLLSVAAPLAAADPIANPPVVPVANAGPPPPSNGAVASAAPGVVTTPDGWTLTVSAKNETQLPVAPLTTALSSREYLVGGTFAGSVTGKGNTKLTGGTMEAGYQIGCGIALDKIELDASLGLGGTFGATGLSSVTVPLSGIMEVELQPGTVTTVPVDKKVFKSGDPRVSITSFHIKIDGCVGQSFLRSYATLTSTTDNSADVVSYTGVTLAA
jgi:MspA